MVAPSKKLLFLPFNDTEANSTALPVEVSVTLPLSMVCEWTILVAANYYEQCQNYSLHTLFSYFGSTVTDGKRATKFNVFAIV